MKHKPIINYYEEEHKIGDLEIIYKAGIVKENFISSILSDTYTFGILVFSFWVNQTFIHSRILSFILLFCFLFDVNFSTRKKIVTKEEFKNIMNEYLGE